ncbi:HNH endonuclease [Bradyrhizobium japonicum]|uniref:HNH endonuclease n=1 Tax=Bradyrhizobium japonicum TaxID=375 RepID=UPI00041E0859|nr:HNH endonuclease signature motif containing protein [Bradyrhizobium japonicum]
MSRREFSKEVKRQALKRAAGQCEAEGCGALFGVKFHFDHVIADGLGGEPTLENCAVLCHVCHGEKTRKHDVPRIAKMKRIRDKHSGITAPRGKIQSRGFAKAPPQRKASAPIEKWRGF